MIKHPAFPVEPWSLRETELDLDLLAQTESVFALSNGHIGLRGNLDEGEPFGLPGTYLAGFYELRPLPYAEAGYGYPEAGQTVVNVTNGKLIRLLVEDEPFDVRYGELRATSACSTSAPGVLRRTRRVGVADRARASGSLDAAGLVRAARDRGDPLRGRGARRARCRSSCSRSWSPTSRCPTADGDPRRRRGARRRRCARSTSTRDDTRAMLVHSTSAQRAADGRGDGPRDRRAATGTDVDVESFDGPRRV